MFLEKNAFFYVYLIVFVINTFNVQVKSDEPDEGERIRLKLEQFMTVPPMPFITIPYTMVFEGVDYEYLKVLNKPFYDQYIDCYWWFTQCIRDMTNFHTICAYFGSYWWVTMTNLCQLDLENCRHRTAVFYWKPSQGVYGTYEGHWYDKTDLMFYHGDGYNCKYSFRRNVPDNQVNFYFEDQQTLYRRTVAEIEENYNGTIQMLDQVKDLRNSTEETYECKQFPCNITSTTT